MEIKSNITQVPKKNRYTREIFVVQFSIYKWAQHKFTHRLFSKCINLCDVSENFSNTKKPTIIVLPDQ